MIIDDDKCYEKKYVTWTLILEYFSTTKFPQACTSFKVSSCLNPSLLSMPFIYLFLFIYCFLELHPQHMETPRLGVQSELQSPTYTTAPAMPDPSHISRLYCSSQQRRILDPLSEARGQGSWILVRFVTC